LGTVLAIGILDSGQEEEEEQNKVDGKLVAIVEKNER
jgi:hypothetical protein